MPRHDGRLISHSDDPRSPAREPEPAGTGARAAEPRPFRPDGPSVLRSRSSLRGRTGTRLEITYRGSQVPEDGNPLTPDMKTPSDHGHAVESNVERDRSVGSATGREEYTRPVAESPYPYRGMCAVGFSPGAPLANALGHGVLGTLVSRPHRAAAASLRAGTPASSRRAVPRTPCPRKRLRGVKSAGYPLEPTPNHGTAPAAPACPPSLGRAAGERRGEGSGGIIVAGRPAAPGGAFGMGMRT